MLIRSIGSLRTTRLGILHLIMFSLLSACMANLPSELILPSSTPPMKRQASTLTPIIATTQPTITPSLMPNCEVEFGYVYAESKLVDSGCLLSILPGDYHTIGYRLIHPNNWNVSLVGANNFNLSFYQMSQSGSRQELFLQAISTRLTLDEADQADAGDEIIGPRPLVLPEETVLEREIILIRGVQPVLQLNTSIENMKIRRYFIIKEIPHLEDFNSSISMLFMFRTSASSEIFITDEYQDFLCQIEEIVLSVDVLK